MRLKWRLTEIWQKALFLVVGWGVLALFLFVLRTWVLDSHSWTYALIGLVVQLGYTFVGVRIFRGYLEPTAPPRLWWRWTGRPKAGFWLGALYAATTLSELQEFWPRAGLGVNYALASLNMLESAMVAVGFLNSSFRLRPHPELWSQRRGKARPAESAVPQDAV